MFGAYNVEIWQLRYFLAVADELNFGRAAMKLNVAQPSVTRAVQGLEREIGIGLVLRDKRRVELTPAGRNLAEDARRLLSQAETSVLRAQRIARGEAGWLTIGFEGSAAFAFVPQAVKTFRARYPQFTFELVEMPTADQVVALKEGRIDLGFVVPPADDPDIQIELVASEHLVVAMPASHRLRGQKAVKAADLAGERFIAPSKADTCGVNRAIIGVLNAVGTHQLVAQVNDIQLSLCFVAAGEGVTLVPSSVAQITRRGVSYRPLQRAVRVDIAVARLSGAEGSSSQARFVEASRQAAREQRRGR
jgi:LysR family transcriptional regulator, benzoate and cis,cis-muconate-responsive activator of ben and cat genes